MELASTEEIAREARPLRSAEQTAAAQAAAATSAVELAKVKCEELELAYKAADDRHQAAVQIHTGRLTEQQATEVLLRKVCALDQTLSIVQTQFQKARADDEVANAALKAAELKLQSTVDYLHLTAGTTGSGTRP